MLLLLSELITGLFVRGPAGSAKRFVWALAAPKTMQKALIESNFLIIVIFLKVRLSYKSNKKYMNSYIP
jgi:hypothetical protein